MLTSNAVILGVIAVALVWAFKKLNWTPDGTASLWVTMGVAVLLGIAEGLLSGTFVALPACSMGEPANALVCITDLLTKVLENFGIVMGTSTAIYKLLRKLVDTRGTVL